MTKYKGQFPSVYEITDYGQRIGNEANRLAYPNNPKVAQYIYRNKKGKPIKKDGKYVYGHPTPQFKSTMNAVTKGFHFWNAWSRVGASCDVFVGTCVRAVYNREFPLGLWKQLRWMKTHPDFVEVKDHTNLQDGDIIIYKKAIAGRHGHICIYYNGKIKEASAKHFYGRTTDQVANRLSAKGKKYVYVFRIKDGKKYCPLEKGMTGDEVKRLQRYLNWYFKGDDDLKPLKVDGIFGSITKGYVKAMQVEFNKQGKLKVIDGVAGTKTLAVMKGVSK